MTLYTLDVAPDDVAAAELGYRVDTDPAPPALATTLLDHPNHPASLRLAILGASHSVTVVVDGLDTITEEVSCRASTSGGGLPLISEIVSGSVGTHRLRGAVETEHPAAFSELVRELTERAANDPEILAGRFPGGEGALTVVEARAEDQGWRWRTWHLYPADERGGSDAGGEIVTTDSWFELALADAVTGEVS